MLNYNKALYQDIFDTLERFQEELKKHIKLER
jgi:hypothetical protein